MKIEIMMYNINWHKKMELGKTNARLVALVPYTPAHCWSKLKFCEHLRAEATAERPQFPLLFE